MALKMVIIAILFFGLMALIIEFVYPLWMRFIKGKKKYKGTYVKSYGGFRETYRWCKSDEEALKEFSGEDFIERVYPDKERLRPKN